MTPISPIRDLRAYLEGQANLLERLIAAASNPMHKAYISLLGRAGVRVSEANQLGVDHIDFERRTLTIVHLKERSKLKCPNCGETLGRRHLFCPSCGNKVEQAVREKVEQRRQRIIPVDSTTLALLRGYLEWRRRFPNAEVHAFSDAGHYVLEDVPDEIVILVKDFLQN